MAHIYVSEGVIIGSGIACRPCAKPLPEPKMTFMSIESLGTNFSEIFFLNLGPFLKVFIISFLNECLCRYRTDGKIPDMVCKL